MNIKQKISAITLALICSLSPLHGVIETTFKTSTDIDEKLNIMLKKHFNENNFNNIAVKLAGSAIAVAGLITLGSGILTYFQPEKDTAKKKEQQRKAYLPLGLGAIGTLAGSLLIGKSGSFCRALGWNKAE